jgi:raffinose/stachyose/melibiose transport system substrate-binding protein
MKSVSKVLAILMLFVLIVAACAPAATEAPETTEPSAATEAPAATEEAPATEAPAQEKTIRFLSGQTEDTGYTKIIVDLTKEYVAEHPNVTFEFESYTQTDLQARIQQLAASNALPTLFPNPANETLAQMYENGQVLDVEATFKELGIWDQVNPGAAALLSAKEGDPNVLYELPVELNVEGFWYNKQIFADNGIEVPTTWDELIAAADKLQAAGIQPFSASGQQGWPLTRLLGGYAVRNYGIDAMARVASGELKLTDPGFVAAADTLKMMADKEYFGKGLTTIDYDTAVDVFLQGKAAMFYMGSWELRDFNNPERNKIGADNIGLFNVPMVKDGKGSMEEWSENAGLTLAVNKAEYDPILADWLKYVFSNFGDRAMAEQGAITGFKVNNMPADVPALTQMTLETISSASAGYLWWEARFNSVGNQSSTDLVQKLVTEADYTGEQYMTDLQAALEQK